MKSAASGPCLNARIPAFRSGCCLPERTLTQNDFDELLHPCFDEVPATLIAHLIARWVKVRVLRARVYKLLQAPGDR
jgi:hypothetical protein